MINNNILNENHLRLNKRINNLFSFIFHIFNVNIIINKVLFDRKE